VKKSNNKYLKNKEYDVGKRRPGGIQKKRKYGNKQRQTVSNLSEYRGRGLKLTAHFSVVPT
jgi:hypothetical protein